MTLQGTITEILPIEQGTNSNGEWRKQQFVVSYNERYPQKVCFSLWGKKIDENKLILDAEVAVKFDLYSREYNGKWFTEAKAWEVWELIHDTNKIKTDDVSPSQVDHSDDDEVLPF